MNMKITFIIRRLIGTADQGVRNVFKVIVVSRIFSSAILYSQIILSVFVYRTITHSQQAIKLQCRACCWTW